eukprot:1370909-Heterocapsa_arctica.AAC.1
MAFCETCRKCPGRSGSQGRLWLRGAEHNARAMGYLTPEIVGKLPGYVSPSAGKPLAVPTSLGPAA